MEFEWDDDKNDRNFEKHGLRFEDVIIIFRGPTSTELDDRDYDEDRYITTGFLRTMVVVVVVHTDRNGRIRIISAREATRRERKQFYEKYIGPDGERMSNEGWEKAVVTWPDAKEQVTLNIDKFIVDYFKQHGSDLESDINEALRSYVTFQLVEKSKAFYAQKQREQQKQPE
jgi:uncharacterized DUF497 family protein